MKSSAPAPECVYVCGYHKLRCAFIEVNNLGALRMVTKPGANLMGVQVAISKYYIPHYAERCGKTLVFPDAKLDGLLDVEELVEEMLIMENGRVTRHSLVEKKNDLGGGDTDGMHCASGSGDCRSPRQGQVDE